MRTCLAARPRVAPGPPGPRRLPAKPVLLACLLAALAGSARGAPVPMACPGSPDVVITAAAMPAAQVQLACDGAADARRFLAPILPAQAPPLQVEIVDAMPPDLRADAVGCYAHATRRILVLDLPQFLARGRWFGVPVSEALYRAVVAHEVAHAIVGCHTGERRIPTAAHEYVAYVTMFATMPAALREAALQALPGRGLGADAELNDLRYAYDPMLYGVDAWRHWQRQADGAGFLRRVVRGEVAVELD